MSGLQDIPRSPDSAKARIDRSLVSLLDFAPTILDQAGLGMEPLKPRL